ncbi:MAG TPA: hypothetical protein VN693_08485 [Rhodanobacteraceae bacterium]|nr:hypothetical protein [Rhodanobacteraceae bacterium]
MFVSGVSSIESTVYAIATLAAHPTICSLQFGPAEQKACSPQNLLKRLEFFSQATEIIAVLRNLVSSKEWRMWVDLRNRMAHRSNLPRIVHIAMGGPLPVSRPILFAATSSTPSIDLGIEDFDALQAWLASELRILLLEGTNFVKNRQCDQAV